MNPLHIGVIGAGSISSMHLTAYQANEDAVVHAVCDLREERAREAARRFGATHTFTDYRELLADPAIDAVSVCTWNDTHAEIAMAAIRAGKHVLVEKPMCRTVAEAEALRAVVRASDRVLQVGFVRRYDPNVQLLRRFTEGGELGDIYYAKASSLRRLGNPGGWFADEARSGGGPLLDIGVHAIDLCWYMMGKPPVAAVSGHTYRKLGNRANVRGLSFYRAADYDAAHNTVEDLANALIRFENGASLAVDASYTLHAAQDESSIKLYGTKGGLEIDPAVRLVAERHDAILNVTPQLDSPGLDVKRAFQAEIHHFLDCIRRGSEPLSPVEDGLTLMKILCGIYESAARGEEIRL